jgi:hypothetical protein
MGPLSRSSVGLEFEQQFARVPNGFDELRIDEDFFRVIGSIQGIAPC